MGVGLVVVVVVVESLGLLVLGLVLVVDGADDGDAVSGVAESDWVDCCGLAADGAIYSRWEVSSPFKFLRHTGHVPC